MSFSRQGVCWPFFIFVVYTILSLAATHPLWLHLTTQIAGDIGDPLLNTWIIAWDVHALLTDPIHLFDANIFYPLRNTLAYSEHLLGNALLAVPLLLLSGEPLLSYNLIFLASFILSALGMYYLVHHYIKNRAVAFLAGVAFAFAPYRLASMAHLQLLNMQWLSFSVLHLDRFLESRRLRDLALFTLFLWLQVISSWHGAAFLTLVAVVYLLYHWLFHRGTRMRSAVGLLVLSALVIVLLVSPLAIPYLQAWPELRETRTAEVTALFSASPTDYLAASPFNRPFGHITASFRARPAFTEEHFLFPGVTAPLLAALSLGTLWQGRGNNKSSPGPFLIILLCAFAFTLGPSLLWYNFNTDFPLPYRLLQSALPATELMRVPPRWVVPALFAMSVLVGYGSAWLHSVIKTPPDPGSWTLILPLSLLLFAEGYSSPIPLAEVGPLSDLPVVYRWLAKEPGPFAVLEIPLHSAPQPEYPETKRLYASTLRWWGLVNGYSGFTPKRQTLLAEKLQGFPDDESLAAIRSLGEEGVRYVVVHAGEEGLDAERWREEGQWLAARSTTLRLVHSSQGNYVYGINPLGDDIVLVQEKVPPSQRESLPHLVQADFADVISLLAYEVQEEEDALVLILYWQAQRPVERDYTVFVHLLDGGGQLLAQGDGPPVWGHYPTSVWPVGEVIQDEHRIAVGHSHAEKGEIFRVGLYLLSSGERLPLVNDKGEVTGDSLLLPR
ncbi:MAG: hypothetical protein ACE5NP_01815 [Anaerolineae bacterium]